MTTINIKLSEVSKLSDYNVPLLLTVAAASTVALTAWYGWQWYKGKKGSSPSEPDSPSDLPSVSDEEVMSTISDEIEIESITTFIGEEVVPFVAGEVPLLTQLPVESWMFYMPTGNLLVDMSQMKEIEWRIYCEIVRISTLQADRIIFPIEEGSELLKLLITKLALLASYYGVDTPWTMQMSLEDLIPLLLQGIFPN
jgi:hypothetical protein